MDVLQKYLDIGLKLGLEGQDLGDFVSDRERIDRENRHAVREREREEKDREREEKQEVKENQTKIEELRLELQLTVNRRVSDNHRSIKQPPLQPFREDTINLKSYLDMFERYAHDAKWEFEACASKLGRLLSGNALDVYSKLPLVSANEYDTLKQALLERYQLTETEFKAKSYSSRLQEHETSAQCMERLRDALHSWVELSKIDRS